MGTQTLAIYARSQACVFESWGGLSFTH